MKCAICQVQGEKKTTTNGRAVAAAPVDMFICDIF